jgi:hypothetical protein
LCFYSKTFDQNGLYQAIVDLTFLDCNQLWQDQFIPKIEKSNALVKKESSYSIVSSDGGRKRRSEDLSSEDKTLTVEDHILKKRRSSIQPNDEPGSKVDK